MNASFVTTFIRPSIVQTRLCFRLSVARFSQSSTCSKRSSCVMSSTANYSTSPSTNSTNAKLVHSSQHPNVNAKWRAEHLITAKELNNTIAIKTHSAAESLNEASTVVLFVTSEELKGNFIPSSLGKLISSRDVELTAGQQADFKAEVKSCLTIYPRDSSVQRFILIGLGDRHKLTLKSLRSAINKAVDVLKGAKVKSAHLIAPTQLGDSVSFAAVLDCCVRIAILTNHVFDKYLTLKPKHRVEELTIVTAAENAACVVKSAQQCAEATCLARELSNDRADTVTPQYVEDQARALVQTHNNCLSIRVLQHDELLANGYNMISAVGQGARHRARLVVIEYYSAAAVAEKRIALVGKGITFDTGGLNMKPTKSIEDMYMDMSGAAVVLSTMKAIALQKPSVNVVGVLCLAENSVDQLSVKPHTILHTAKGTMLINNTDAEGRLALADGMTYVQSNYSVSDLLDIATLTGAVGIALGDHKAGVFSNSDQQVTKIIEIGESLSESCWRLPVEECYADELKDHYSDFKNTSGGRLGGASIAAAFLEKYVEPGVCWTHIDIAGVGMLSKAREWMCQGGTGFGCQILTEFVKHKANQRNSKI